MAEFSIFFYMTLCSPFSKYRDPAHPVQGLIIALAVMASTFLTNTVQAAVIYRQTFGTAITSRTYDYYHTVGWSYHASIQNSLKVDGPVEDSVNGVNRGLISTGIGKPSDVNNVNTPNPSASIEKGIALVRSYNTDRGVKGLLYTEHFTIDQSAYQIDSVEWYSLGRNIAGTFEATESLAIRVDGTWYITEPAAPAFWDSSATTDFVGKAELKTLNFASATWHELTANLGSPFAVGAEPTALPGGLIDAFGFYIVTGDYDNQAYVYVDSLTINATTIPEPGNTALLLGGGLICWFAFRRKNASRTAA